MLRFGPLARLIAAVVCSLLISAAGVAHRAPPSADALRAVALLTIAGDASGICGSGAPLSHGACGLCCMAANAVGPASTWVAPPRPAEFAAYLGAHRTGFRVAAVRDWSNHVRAPPGA